MNDKRFNRLNAKSFTLDFAGRKIVDDRQVISAKNYEKEIEEILKDGDETVAAEEADDASEASHSLMNKDIGNITLTVCVRVFSNTYIIVVHKLITIKITI